MRSVQSRSSHAPLDVEIQDRILKSANDQVKVTNLPGFSEDFTEALPGVRSWMFRLAPQEHKILEMPLTIRAPKDGVISGLNELSLPNS